MLGLFVSYPLLLSSSPPPSVLCLSSLSTLSSSLADRPSSLGELLHLLHRKYRLLPPLLSPPLFHPPSPLVLVSQAARLIISSSCFFPILRSHACRHHLLISETSPPSGLPSVHISSSHPLLSVSSSHSYPQKKKKKLKKKNSESSSLIPLIPISLSPLRHHHSPLYPP